MVTIDPISLLNMIVPLAVAFGLSILTLTLTHLALSASGNRFATEISAVTGLVVFSLIEVLLGAFTMMSVLGMLCIVTTMVMAEVYRPNTDYETTSPQLLNLAHENDVLCFSTGKEYSALAAISVVGIPAKSIHQEGEENADLKWLFPLWEDGKQILVTYTLEAVLEDGLVDIRFFVSSQDKDWKESIKKTRRGRQLIESWLSKKHFEFTSLLSDDLWNTYSELNTLPPIPTDEPEITNLNDSYLGMLSIDGVPISPSSNIGDLLQQFVRMKVSGRILVSFNSGSIPKVRDEISSVRVDPQHQPRVAPRVEEHKHRKMHKQMAELEVCEETGSFRVGLTVLVHGSSIIETKRMLSKVNATCQGVLGGTSASTLSAKNMIRIWRKLLLRQVPLGNNPISGARLTALLHLSSGLPGTPSRISSPDFGLPLQTISTEKAPTIGSVFYKDEVISQEYRIPIDAFCYHGILVGNPGSGKTNTAQLIVYEVFQYDIPFLVIVPAKKDWRVLCNYIPETRVFGAPDLRFNFMDVPTGVSVATHISNITTCFISAWPTEGIMKQHIKKIFRRAYENAGWDLFRNIRGDTILLTDLYEAMEEVANELRYSGKMKQDFIGALSSRFDSLLEDPILSIIFNTTQGLSIQDLLSNPTILELNHLISEHKSLITSLIMVGIKEYLEANSDSSNSGLKHLLVLEEAHNVLKQVGGIGGYEGHSAQQHAIDTIVQSLREARGLGLGVLLIDQLPGHLAVAAVKLPGITIIHTLFDARERTLVGAHANLTDEQLMHIGLMRCGEAIIHQAFAGEAVKVKIRHFNSDPDPTEPPWTDEKLSTFMAPFYETHSHLREVNIPTLAVWVPDEKILTELLYLIECSQFESTYENRKKSGEESALNYVRQMVSQYTSIPMEIEAYTKQLIAHIENQVERVYDEGESLDG